MESKKTRTKWIVEEQIIALHYFFNFSDKTNNSQFNYYLRLFCNQQKRIEKNSKGTFNLKLRNYKDENSHTSKMDRRIYSKYINNKKQLEKDFTQISNNTFDVIFNYPDSETDLFLEGKQRKGLVNIRSRSKKLRNMAIEKYGYICGICKLNLKSKYADKAIVHVHHKIPLYMSDKPVQNSLGDVIVICPSCHAAVHKNPKMVLSVDDAIKLFN